jgi:hypothetical protein
MPMPNPHLENHLKHYLRQMFPAMKDKHKLNIVFYSLHDWSHEPW